MPKRESLAFALRMAIPAGTPSLLSFQVTATGTKWLGYATHFGLVWLTNSSGKVQTEVTPIRAGATAYRDPAGNVVVAYAWDDSPAENILAGAI